MDVIKILSDGKNILRQGLAVKEEIIEIVGQKITR